MSRKVKALIFFLFIASSCIFVFISHASATTYYVATTGNDSNVGTIDNPWRTVRKATNTIVAGDTAYVRGGTYTENLISFANSGISGNVITLAGYPGETAVIDGGITSAGARRPVFDIDNRNYITLDNLTITRGDTANIYIGYNSDAESITISNSILTNFVANDNSGYIYMSGGNNIVIYNNLMYGYQGTSGNKSGIIMFQSGNVTIRNNEIYNTGNGIYYKHSSNNGSATIIENNLLHNLEKWGIEASKKDVVIRNNVIRDIANSTGILIFEESASCDRLISADNQIIHNTLVDVLYGIALARSTSCPGAINTIVKDNLIYNFIGTWFRGFSVYLECCGVDLSNTTFDHNLIYSSAISSPIRVLTTAYTVNNVPLTGSGNIQSIPIFVDYTGRNFTLISGSAGRNAASDGADMGANISFVGINAGQTSDTTPPTIPSGFSANTISSSQINLTWVASTDNMGVTGYRIERCQGSNCTNFTQIATLIGTSYNDTGLLSSTTYRYQIRAIDAARNFSGYSFIISAVTQGSQGSTSFECQNWQTIHPEWIFCDDFESGVVKIGTGGYFEYDNNAGDFIVQNGVGVNSSQGMRARWQAGEVNAGGLELGFGRNPISYMNTGIRSAEDFRDIYYRMYVKTQPNWQGDPNKLSRATVFANTNWGQAMIAHLWGDGQNRLLIDPASCVDASDNVRCNTYNDFANLQWLGNRSGITPVFSASNSNQWHCVEHHVKLNNSGLSNGLQEFWINSQLEAQRSGLNFVGAYTAYGINAVFFENYWNNGSPVQQERYFDNIVVSTQPIGCLASVSFDATPPNAPTGLTVL